MDIRPEHRKRLDALMDQRRLELGMSWREVAAAARLSYETVRTTRLGTGGIPELTARKLDRALQWQAGSIAAIIAGEPGEPAELPEPGTGRGSPVTDLRPAVVRDYWDDAIIGDVVRRIWDLDGRYVPTDQKLAVIERLAAVRGDDGAGSGARAADRP